MGSFGSRGAMMGGAAVMGAAVKVRAQLLEKAAEELEAAPDDLVVTVDGVSVLGAPSRSVALPSISVEDRFVCELLGFPYGVHLAAVEVDTGTGAVRVHRYAVGYDIGRAISPVIVRGRIPCGFGPGLGG